MMGGWRKKKDSDASKDKGGEQPKPAPVRVPVDDVYETGDIAAPERDRDDEQRDL
ncbi:hypothetical protein SR870_20665 [Rhodopseudomonas palustris]|uniref:hypothetical protein n=1 Tax=Rhodopseudomonas palustris TaxID=1076 RepID=UPI002ACE50C8|nr:hypothetical protein [Rhodopseudomonas palustris]WQG99064.1 hypothetical protein SR870_20665 [Rhodopseudomonas palustris]